MRNLRKLDKYRLNTKQQYGWSGDGTCGAFRIVPPFADAMPLLIIAASGEGWDHVSVSRVDKPPSWAEMAFIKSKFFKNDETVMQLHVPESDHINCHPYCLHLWRPHAQEIPRPPSWMVGLKNMHGSEVKRDWPQPTARV